MLHRIRLFLLFAICPILFSFSQIAAQDETPSLPPADTTIPTLPLAEIPTDLPTATLLPTLTPMPSPSETPTPLPTPTESETPTLEISKSPAPTLTDTTPTATSSVDYTTTVTPTLTETTTGTAPAIVTPTVTASSTQSLLPPEPQLSSTLFDSFDSPVLVNWAANPAWSIIANDGGQALQTATGAPLTFAAPALPHLYEVAVELRVRFSTGVFLMDLRQNTTGDYAAELNANGQINLYRLGQLMTTANVAPNVVGQWRTFRLSAVDTVVRLSIDGAEVAGFIDTVPLPRGGLSISASGLAGDGLTVDDMKLWWYDRTLKRDQTHASLHNPIAANSLVSASFTVPNLEAVTYISTTTGIPNTNQLYSVYGVNTIAHPLVQGTLFYTATSSPVWSPTLPLLAYVCNDANPPNPSPIQTICIGKVDTALQQTAVITIGVAANATNPRWSPDGTRLLWEEPLNYNANGFNVLSSDIYQFGVTLQNGIIQITSPRTLVFNSNCMRSSFSNAVVNRNTVDWGKNGFIYFGLNFGTAGNNSVGFFRFNGQNPPTGNCPSVQPVVSLNDLIGFNNLNSTSYTMDTRSPVRVRQTGDLLFGDAGGNIMLYKPANTLFKRAIDFGAAYSWSPDETQVAFIRRPISGIIVDKLMVKIDPDGTDSSNVQDLSSGTEPNQTRGLTWNVPHLQVLPTPTPTPTPTVSQQIIQDLATKYKVVIVNPNNWTLLQLQELQIGVQKTAEALKSFVIEKEPTDSRAAEVVFRNIMIGATDNEVDVDIDTSAVNCTTNQDTTVPITARITCYPGASRFTFIHEFGHVFSKRTGKQQSGITSFYGLVEFPVPAGGSRRRITTFKNKILVFGEFSWSVTSVPSNPLPPAPTPTPQPGTPLTDWTRGANGWGSGADVLPPPKPADIVPPPNGAPISPPNPTWIGPCGVGASATGLPTIFQQNPCQVRNWVVKVALDGNLAAYYSPQPNDLPALPDDRKKLNTNEIEETAADMFLNWVTKKIGLTAPDGSNGFANEVWKNRTTSVPDNTNKPGDRRYQWMNCALIVLFNQHQFWQQGNLHVDIGVCAAAENFPGLPN